LQRNTKQREAILSCFSGEDRPMTATEIHTLAREEYPSLGIATVYRTVNAFVEAGVLAPVFIGGATRYELAEKRHHHHFHCQECDRAFCLQGRPVSEKGLAPKGFTVRDHDLVVSGACPACASNGKGGH
jgi:Fur family ferric uptake transcriptional regulator